MPTALVRLLEERFDAGDSRRAIAKRANIGAATVGRIADGADAKVSSIVALAPALDLPASEVLRLAGTDADQELDADGQLIMDMLGLLPDSMMKRLTARFRDMIVGALLALEFTENSDADES